MPKINEPMNKDDWFVCYRWFSCSNSEMFLSLWTGRMGKGRYNNPWLPGLTFQHVFSPNVADFYFFCFFFFCFVPINKHLFSQNVAHFLSHMVVDPSISSQRAAKTVLLILILVNQKCSHVRACEQRQWFGIEEGYRGLDQWGMRGMGITR